MLSWWKRQKFTQTRNHSDKLIDPEVRLDSSDVNHLVEVSLNSVARLTSHHTLTDPGATHNFLAFRVVKEPSIPVTDTEPYGLKMGTGDIEEGRGV